MTAFFNFVGSHRQLRHREVFAHVSPYFHLSTGPTGEIINEHVLMMMLNSRDCPTTHMISVAIVVVVT